jgi:hypothetical protein
MVTYNYDTRNLWRIALLATKNKPCHQNKRSIDGNGNEAIMHPREGAVSVVAGRIKNRIDIASS